MTVYKVLELFHYTTLVKIEPSAYCHSSTVFWGDVDHILNNHEDILVKMEVELIKRGPQAIHIYYNEVSDEK